MPSSARLICLLMITSTTLGYISQVSAANQEASLEVVAEFPKLQVTGIAVSRKSGRIFVNFPDWSDDHSLSVAELMKDGSLKPYPNREWNVQEGAPEKRLVCVQSVSIDDADTLWILDPASPKMNGVLKGGAKLLQVNLQTNEVERTILFPDEVAPEKSYLNDVRVDIAKGFAFITESAIGSLIVVDLKTGKSRRLLVDAPVTKKEMGMKLVVDGILVLDPKTHTTPAMNVDGLALDLINSTVYFHALAGHLLYKITENALTDPNLAPQALSENVIKVGETPPPDGMLADSSGHIYLTDLEHNAIVRWDIAEHQWGTVIQDDRLQWPDSMSWGPGGYLYVTTSQIHRTARFNHGVTKLKGSYGVYRIQLPAKPQ